MNAFNILPVQVHYGSIGVGVPTRVIVITVHMSVMTFQAFAVHIGWEGASFLLFEKKICSDCLLCTKYNSIIHFVMQTSLNNSLETSRFTIRLVKFYLSCHVIGCWANVHNKPECDPGLLFNLIGSLSLAAQHWTIPDQKREKMADVNSRSGNSFKSRLTDLKS